MQPLLIALQFLTCLPIRLASMPTAEQLGRSLLWYPLVGFLLGLLLCGLSNLLAGSPSLLHAALLLTAWVVLSGGLHLDGLADSADAWLGGLGDRERTLLIMKDPRSGPIAVVTLVALLEQGQWTALLLAPWLARGLLPLLFLTTAYVRAGGLGQALAEHLPRQTLPWLLGAHGLAVALFGPAGGVGGWGRPLADPLPRQPLPWLLAAHGLAIALFGPAGWLALVLALVMFAWLRRLMIARLGGTTGDTAGALVELVECVVLVGLALY